MTSTELSETESRTHAAVVADDGDVLALRDASLVQLRWNDVRTVAESD